MAREEGIESDILNCLAEVRDNMGRVSERLCSLFISRAPRRFWRISYPPFTLECDSSLQATAAAQVLNSHIVSLNERMMVVEKALSAVHLPLQATMYEYTKSLEAAGVLAEPECEEGH